MQTTLATTFDYSAIERAALQPTTKTKYTTEIQKMRAAGVDPFDHAALQLYAAGLKSSRKSFLKSGLRIMALDYENTIKASATPDNVNVIQAGVYRLESMRNAVTVELPKGTKSHNWLTPIEVTKLTGLCDDSLTGKRDYIILGLLVGAGLRREELAQLTFDDIKQQGDRTVIEVTGKGNKTRIIPLSEKLVQRLAEWRAICGSGSVARAMVKKSKTEMGASMSAASIFELVRKYGAMIGRPELAPHDLRRSFAQIGYDAGISIVQISTLLGHSSVSVTQKYLNLALDLKITVSDFIPLAE